MANQKAIKQKMRSVSNLEKITRAMEMVARSKMKRAVDAAFATRTFARLARELLANLSHEQFEDNIYLIPGDSDRSLMVLMTSNKGLCGGYNAIMYRSLRRFFEERDAAKFDVISIGRYASGHAKKLGLKEIGNYSELVDAATADSTVTLARAVTKAFVEGNYSRVYLAYTDFESAFTQTPRIVPLLPLTLDRLDQVVASVGGDLGGGKERVEDGPEGMKNKAQYVFEPDEGVIIDYVIPGLIHTQLYQGLLESAASEHAARMVAMKSASENASELHEGLKLSYNRARQAGITNELIDIAAGADAVSAG